MPTENALWGAEEILAAIPGVAIKCSWKHGRLLSLYPVLNDTFMFFFPQVVLLLSTLPRGNTRSSGGYSDQMVTGLAAVQKRAQQGKEIF